MAEILVKKLHNILEDVPELSHVLPEDLLFELRPTDNPKSAVKVFENILDLYSSRNSGSASINLFPSISKGDCREVCIGIATRSFGSKRDENRNRTGFKGLIKEIIQYWQNCGSVNMKTILFTCEWRDSDFNKDWKDIVENYKNQGKKVIIIEFWDGGYIKRFPIK